MSPQRPARPCRAPGCPNLVRGPGSYCPEHAREVQRRYDAERGSPSRRGYGRNWRRLRAIVLAEQPLCADPDGVHGDEPPLATEVDHIVPLRAGGTNARSNLQALCKSCHSRKTAREDQRWGGA